MAPVITNIIAGAATLYVADFGATEPADGDVETAPAVAWVDAGATNDGVKTLIEREFYNFQVDQIIDPVGSREISRRVRVQTNLAEATLDALEIALNDVVTATGTGFDNLEPAAYSAGEDPTYRAFMLDGPGPNGLARRFIIRKGLSVGNIESAYRKDGMWLVPLDILAHWVSASIKPWRLIQEKP